MDDLSSVPAAHQLSHYIWDTDIPEPAQSVHTQDGSLPIHILHIETSWNTNPQFIPDNSCHTIIFGIDHPHFIVIPDHLVGHVYDALVIPMIHIQQKFILALVISQ
jgi:hypothetical protein